jgi:putative phage-type endonuclease
MIFDHEARKKSLGASEVAAILGVNENMSPLDVWLVKTGRKPPFEGNEHTRRGNRQETQILEWLAEDLGDEFFVCQRVNTEHFEGSEIASATPDAYVCRRDYFEPMHDIPLRQYVLGLWKKIRDDGKLIEICEAKSTLKTIADVEDIPVTWLIQCQWQMLCTGLKKAHLAIFGPMVSNYQRFEIAYDHDYAMQLLALAEQWWETHVVGDKEPDPISEADILLLYPQSNGLSMDAVDEVYEAICEMNDYKAQAKEVAAKIDGIRERVVLAIGPNEVVKYGGRWIASYKTNSKGSRTLRTL